MAYAAVASVSETIDIVLASYPEADSIISREFEVQMKSIQKHSVFFRSFLEEFRERGNNWDETIREVTDRAEEIIELLLSDLLMLETTTRSGGSGSRSGSESLKSKFQICYSLGDLKRVSEEMESMSNRIKGKDAEATGGGDEEQLMEIISRLLGSGSPSRELIAIIGMGGMGKAALARNVYEHPLTVEHFDVRAWSTISQDYRPRRIMVELLRCMKAKTESIPESENEMMERLYRTLFGRRYLIVLNDIWSMEAWDEMKRCFPDNGNGSRIVLTTRSSKLCRAAGASYVHQMRLLDDDSAWNEVRQNVFGGDPCPSRLESVGKMIARSCGGNQLCIQVVSGILAAADHTLAAWMDILENIKNADEYEYYGMELLKVLSLSYTYLPHHLKPCFLYFGCFPEDHKEIRVSKLIKLWVAEGFVNETDCKSCEDIGEENVEDLVRRGLVSVTKWKSGSPRRRIKSITIHDVMREMCLRQAKIDYFNHHIHGRFFHHSVVKLLSCRRLSITSSSSNYDGNGDFLKGLVHRSIARTIILSSDAPRFDSTIRNMIPNLRLLRILDLLNAYVHDLPDQVFQLFHLRYLAFHWPFRKTSISSKSISNLQNLQTLIITSSKYGGDGWKFDEIWRMPQLRHLCICYFNFPTHDQIVRANIAMSALEDLQTLSRVENFICSRDNLKLIPNLRKLDLLYTTTDVVQEGYELHNLIYLHRLQTLKIEMSPVVVVDHKMNFAFPPKLKKLNLSGLQIPWEDMNKIVASLPNLEVLKLKRHACIGQTWETSAGGFPQLIYLLIEESYLKNWETEASHFPKLKHLVLRHCSSLLELPYGIEDIPTLELIELDEENHSLSSSAYRIQEDRQSSGDDRLQIRLV